ncbi:hypothetical protein P691DRAFT_723799 [Macrolepiota fuliginosa MF-IS2]|uniref:Uncharacterized protein n=1 Tax=Macrolepiota fuliginosa MF-IS2 TaxID=1400762 RepID=A0A9P5XIJ2_9AGAR|nr:hypothetical protein P691DRAFT_723799 [Macrolepiota fuliginosa MF-IS2]
MKGEKKKHNSIKSRTKVNPEDVRAPDTGEAGAVERFLRLLETTSSSINPDGLKSEINDDAIKKVNRGAFGEVLAFLAEHMRGREEVRKARCQIQAAISTRSDRGGLNTEFHPGLVELERATRRLRAARTAVDVARREREEERKRHEILRKERNDLEDKFWKERELGVFLDVLESRETVRLKRIEEVGRMVNQLRKEVEKAKKTGSTRQPAGSVEMTLPRWRPRFTKETVAVSL